MVYGQHKLGLAVEKYVGFMDRAPVNDKKFVADLWKEMVLPVLEELAQENRPPQYNTAPTKEPFIPQEIDKMTDVKRDKLEKTPELAASTMRH